MPLKSSLHLENVPKNGIHRLQLLIYSRSSPFCYFTTDFLLESLENCAPTIFVAFKIHVLLECSRKSAQLPKEIRSLIYFQSHTHFKQKQPRVDFLLRVTNPVFLRKSVCFSN